MRADNGEQQVPPSHAHHSVKEIPPGWTRQSRVTDAGRRTYSFTPPAGKPVTYSVADAWRVHAGSKPISGGHRGAGRAGFTEAARRRANGDVCLAAVSLATAIAAALAAALGLGSFPLPVAPTGTALSFAALSFAALAAAAFTAALAASLASATLSSAVLTAPLDIALAAALVAALTPASTLASNMCVRYVIMNTSDNYLLGRELSNLCIQYFHS